MYTYVNYESLFAFVQVMFSFIAMIIGIITLVITIVKLNSSDKDTKKRKKITAHSAKSRLFFNTIKGS